MRRPKIEFYKIRLRKKDNSSVTFRELFKLKFDMPERGSTLSDYFSKYREALASELDGEGYYTNEKKKKGYTIDTTIDEEGNPKSTLRANSEKWVISGVLDGGKHGAKRSLGELGDKKKRTPINKDNIVCDKFYFLLYTNIDSSDGLIMIQGYTELKISDIFRLHMADFFTYHKEIRNQIEIYVPDSLREEYLESAEFNSASFSTGWIATPDFDDLDPKTYELQVKVEIIDKSEEKLDHSMTQKLITEFGNFVLKIGNKASLKRKLGDFERKTAKIKDENGKPVSFKIDSNKEITPIIYLEEHGIGVNEETGEIDFTEVDEFCRELLDKLDQEDSPENAVNPI